MLAHSVAVAPDVDQVAVMEQPVDERLPAVLPQLLEETSATPVVRNGRHPLKSNLSRRKRLLSSVY